MKAITMVILLLILEVISILFAWNKQDELAKRERDIIYLKSELSIKDSIISLLATLKQEYQIRYEDCKRLGNAKDIVISSAKGLLFSDSVIMAYPKVK